MVSAAVAGAAALLWLLVAAKAYGTVRSGSVSARWLLATLVFLAAGITVFVPVVQSWLAHTVPVDQLKEPLARTAVVAAAFCAQTLLSLTGDPVTRRVRLRRWVFAVGAITVMWVTFAMGPATPSAQFGSHPVRDLGMTLFILAFLGYLAYAITTVMLGLWRYSLAATDTMRRSLRAIALGCACCLAYVAVKLVAIITFRAGLPMSAAVEGRLGKGFVAAGSVLVVFGAGVLPARERLVELRAWMSDYWSHRRLYPLWADLVQAVPGVALEPAAGRARDGAQLKDMHLRLYRRLIELRDAWLVLRPFLDADVAAAVEIAGRPSGAFWSSAQAEAAALRAGLDAYAANSPAVNVWQSRIPVDGSMKEELDWWTAISRAWTSAPSQRASRPSVTADQW